MQPKIRWRESDKQELRKVLKNFNAKLTRIEKKNPENAKYLPKFWDKEKEVFTNRLSQKQMMDLIQTRKDFNNEIKALRKFSERGMEEIVPIPGVNKDNTFITIWQKEDMERRGKVVNRNRKRRLKTILETPVKDQGEDTGYTHGEARMGNLQTQTLSKIDVFTPAMKLNSLRWKYKGLLYESQHDYYGRRDELLKENYIKGIRTHYDYENVKDIIKEIEKMPINQFLEKFYSSDINFEISSPTGLLKTSKEEADFDNEVDYDIQMEQYDAYVQALKNIWMPKKKVKEKYPKKSTPKKKKQDKRQSPKKENTTKKQSTNTDISENSVSVGMKDGYHALFDNKGDLIGKFSTEDQMNQYIKKHKYKKL